MCKEFPSSLVKVIALMKWNDSYQRILYLSDDYIFINVSFILKKRIWLLNAISTLSSGLVSSYTEPYISKICANRILEFVIIIINQS